jgi:hypothetical protein
MNARFLLACFLFIACVPRQGFADPAAMVSPEQPEQNKFCSEALAHVYALISNQTAISHIKAALEKETRALANPQWEPGYCQALTENLAAKRTSQAEGVQFDEATLINTAIRYEAFRIAAFRNSGVSPKRYFGFLDERGKTATYEGTLKNVATRVARLLNTYAAKNGLDITVTPKEIIVTQLAEGGALLLTSELENADRVHPVLGVGLDDYRKGFQRFPGLIDEVDETFGTSLAELSVAKEGTMTFMETILGTAVMYLYEKEIAEKKRLAKKLPSLKTLSLNEQFVLTSLVYNSGILFSDERVKQIMSFDTGTYLFETSEATAARSQDPRPKLPVILPGAADTLLSEGKSLPQQPTSWNAVYHILQRYGAWVALTKLSNHFTASGEITP